MSSSPCDLAPCSIDATSFELKACDGVLAADVSDGDMGRPGRFNAAQCREAAAWLLDAADVIDADELERAGTEVVATTSARADRVIKAALAEARRNGFQSVMVTAVEQRESPRREGLFEVSAITGAASIVNPRPEQVPRAHCVEAIAGVLRWGSAAGILGAASEEATTPNPGDKP